MSRQLMKSQTRCLQKLSRHAPCEDGIRRKSRRNERRCKERELRNHEENWNCNHARNMERGDGKKAGSCDVIFQNYQELHEILSQIMKNSKISSETKMMCEKKLDDMMEMVEWERDNDERRLSKKENLDEYFNVNLNATARRRSSEDRGEGTSRSPKSPRKSPGKSPRKERRDSREEAIDITFKNFKELQKVMYRVFRNDELSINDKRHYARTIYEMFKLMKPLVHSLNPSGSPKYKKVPLRSSWKTPPVQGMAPEISQISSTTSVSDTNLDNIDPLLIKALFTFYVTADDPENTFPLKGRLYVEEVVKAMKALNLKWPEDTIIEAFFAVDKPYSGMINVSQFREVVNILSRT